MFQDYWKYDWVLKPWPYKNATDLRAGMAAHVVRPAERKARELIARRGTARRDLQPAGAKRDSKQNTVRTRKRANR